IACFDGDPAGRRAAARSFPVFVEAGLWGQGAFLPAGDDPDTYVRAHGAPAFDAVVAAAVPLVDAYVTELAGSRADAVARRADAAREVARVLKKVRNPFEHDVLAHLAAERLGVREELLGREGRPDDAPAATPESRARDGAMRTPADATEASLVALMAADPDAVAEVRRAGVVAAFQHPEWRRAAEALVAAGGAGDRTALVQSLPRELRDRLVARLLSDDGAERADRERALVDCIAAIQRRPAGDAKRRIREAIRAAEACGDEAAATAARREWLELTEKART